MGGGGPLEGVGPENHIKLTSYSTEYTCSKTHVHKITNVPVFYMTLGLNDFDGDKSNTRAIARGGP
jgi:hypothetical protein